MTRLLLALCACVLVACGGAAMQTVQLVNKTPRTIDSIYIFPPGKDHGASKAKLAPNETKTLQLPAGNHEVYAVSEKIVHDDNTRETPEASLTIELRSALELVFYDSNAPVAGIDKPNTRGISFMIRAPKKPADAEGDAPAEGDPAPSAPAPSGP